MALKVIGVGIGRTGTTSLREALSILLCGRCYHFEDVVTNPDHVSLWSRAIRGELTDWELIYKDYVATTDWPGAAFWQELVSAYPDAMVLLSTRRNSIDWYNSAKNTIAELMAIHSPEHAWQNMAKTMLQTRFVPSLHDKSGALAAYERHNELIRASIPSSRLIEWVTGMGWEPLCRGLGLPVPDQPFPHLNTQAEFQEMLSTLGDLPPQSRRASKLLNTFHRLLGPLRR